MLVRVEAKARRVRKSPYQITSQQSKTTTKCRPELGRVRGRIEAWLQTGQKQGRTRQDKVGKADPARQYLMFYLISDYQMGEVL